MASPKQDFKYIERRSLKGGAQRFRVDIPSSRIPGRPKSPWFDDPDLARAWRDGTLHDHERHAAGLLPNKTLGHAVEDFLRAAEAGTAMTRSGAPYKLSALNGYRDALNRVVVPKLGAKTQLSSLHVGIVQERIVDVLLRQGLGRQTVRNYVTALGACMRYAVQRRWIRANPCKDLQLGSAATDRVRDQVVPPKEALRVVQGIAHPQAQLIYALAFFTGQRRGELAALRWEDVSLATRTLTVTRSFEDEADRKTIPAGVEVLGWPDRNRGCYIRPKTKAALRTVPLPDVVLPYLARENRTEGLVCGTEPNIPFTQSTLAKAGVSVSLHQARHTYASILIAAMAAQGKFNPKMLQTAMGHSSITVTYDRYGHLFPGDQEELAGMLDSYIAAQLA